MLFSKNAICSAVGSLGASFSWAATGTVAKSRTAATIRFMRTPEEGVTRMWTRDRLLFCYTLEAGSERRLAYSDGVVTTLDRERKSSERPREWKVPCIAAHCKPWF